MYLWKLPSTMKQRCGGCNKQNAKMSGVFIREISMCEAKFTWQGEGTRTATKHKQLCFPAPQKHGHVKQTNPISCACCLLLKLPTHWTLLQRSYLWVQCLLSDSTLHRSRKLSKRRPKNCTKSNFLCQGYSSCWPHTHWKEADVSSNSLRFTLNSTCIGEISLHRWLAAFLKRMTPFSSSNIIPTENCLKK